MYPKFYNFVVAVLISQNVAETTVQKGWSRRLISAKCLNDSP